MGTKSQSKALIRPWSSLEKTRHNTDIPSKRPCSQNSPRTSTRPLSRPWISPRGTPFLRKTVQPARLAHRPHRRNRGPGGNGAKDLATSATTQKRTNWMLLGRERFVAQPLLWCVHAGTSPLAFPPSCGDLTPD